MFSPAVCIFQYIFKSRCQGHRHKEVGRNQVPYGSMASPPTVTFWQRQALEVLYVGTLGCKEALLKIVFICQIRVVGNQARLIC